MNAKDIDKLECEANKGNLESGYDLGCYYCGITPGTLERGVTSAIDAEIGMHWLEWSAKGGLTDSQRSLGIIYLNGPTVFDVLAADFPIALLYLLLGKHRKKNSNKKFQKGCSVAKACRFKWRH